MDVAQATKKAGTRPIVCTTVRGGISQCDNVTTINGNQIAEAGPRPATLSFDSS